MKLFRLCRKIFAEPLNGKGAALYGARWNSKGTEIIYTSSNRSLAMAEVAVHLTLATLPEDMVMITITLPPNAPILKIDIKDLPFTWNYFPETDALHLIGDRFVREGKYLALKVPSAVTQGDFNLLINPHHRLFSKVKISEIEKFPVNKRLISR